MPEKKDKLKEEISPEAASKLICLSLKMTFDGLTKIIEKQAADIKRRDTALLAATELIRGLEDWIDKRNGDESWVRVTERRKV
ncbi:MAG: hypothetical protein V3W44_08525 [Dehalococcoidales bacterium]